MNGHRMHLHMYVCVVSDKVKVIIQTNQTQYTGTCVYVHVAIETDELVMSELDLNFSVNGSSDTNEVAIIIKWLL